MQLYFLPVVSLAVV